MEVNKYQQEVSSYPDDSFGARQRVRKSASEAVQLLRRGRRTLFIVFGSVLGLVILYTLLVDPEYEAYTVVVVDESSPPGIGEAWTAVGAPDASRLDASNEALLLEQSLVVAERAAERLLAYRDSSSIELTSLEPKGDEPLTVTAIAARLQEDYISVRPENLQPGRNRSTALRITARSTNPEEAALLANALADAYVNQGVEVSQKRTTLARTFLEQQLTQHEERLRGLEKDVERYMTQHGAGALEEEVRETVSRLSKLESDLDAARVEEERGRASLASLEAELESIRPKLTSYIASGAEQEIAQAHDEISRLEGQLEQIYIRNPDLRQDPSGSEDVVALRGKVAQLKERVSRLSAQYVDEVMAVGGTEPLKAGSGSNMTYVAQLKRQIADERVALMGAQAQQSALRSRISQYRGRLGSIPTQSVQLAQLKREHQAAEELYVNLSERLREVQMVEMAEPGLAHIIRPAMIPDSPVRPIFALNLLLGVLLGLSLGVVAAVVRHRLDSRIHTPDDLLAHNMATFGVIPDLQRLQAALHMPILRRDTPVAVPAGSNTPFAEAFRRIYLNVEAHGPAESPSVILITSPEPGAGKSTTVLNLAMAATRAGKRTLILDADLRRPQIYHLLGHSDGLSLEEALGDDDFDVERLQTGIQNVYAIGVHTPLEDPDIVLGTEEMPRLVAQLRLEFDVILIDSPPVLAVADALVLSRLADATLVVASAAGTNVEALEQAMGELRGADAEIMGTILNRYDPESDGSGYQYQYRNYGYL